MTTVSEGGGEGGAKACLGALARSKKRTFGVRKRGILQLYQKVPPWRPEKPDMYWCAPRRAGTLAISVTMSGGLKLGRCAISVLTRMRKGRPEALRLCGTWRLCWGSAATVQPLLP